MRPPRVPTRGADPFLHHTAPLAASSRDRRQKEESKEKREESRERRENGRQLDSLRFYRVPSPRQRSYENQREPPNMAASSNPCIFTGSRGHLDKSAKNNNELPKVSFAKVLKIRGCHEEGRQLISMHFDRVRDHLDGSTNAPKKSFSIEMLL